MLCRALLAAAVFTYVLCVLLLSGVQKEDLDASTLRKLRRHNVNIDDINDRQLQKQCLGKTDVTVTLTTQQAHPTTEKSEIPVTDNGSSGSQADDATSIKKIFEYLEFMRKEDKNKALENKDDAKTSKRGLEQLTTLLSKSSFRNRTQRTDFENPRSERPQRKKTAKRKDDEKIKSGTLNTGLENLMNMLRMNIGSTPDTTQQESTTIKLVADVNLSKNSKDIDYITKIVEEIISRRQLVKINTTNEANINSNETYRKFNQTSDAETKNKTILLTNYFLNNCKIRFFYGNTQGDKDILENVQNQRSRVNELDTNANDDGYFICNRLKTKEQKLVSDQYDTPIINNILNELENERQRFKILDNESAQLTKKYDRIKDSNTHNTEGLNIMYEKPLEAQSKSIDFKVQSDSLNVTNTHKDGIEMSDDKSKNALKDLLQTQSKLFDQIFIQQRNLIKMCNSDKEKLEQRESEGHKRSQSVLKNQPNSGPVGEQYGPMATIHNYDEKRNNYPTQINENVHKLDTKVENDRSKVISQSPQFYYKFTKSDDDVLNDEFGGWHITSNTLNKEDKSIETKNNLWVNNRMDDKLKTTNTGVEHDPNLGIEKKRPWFYAESSNKKPKTEMNGNQQGRFFIPNVHKQIMNVIQPKRKNTYERNWSPYFDKVDNNSLVIRTNEYLRHKNQQLMLEDSANPPLSSLDERKLLRDLMENYSPDGIRDQFETKQDKQINQLHCETTYNTRTKCLSAAEHESDLTYLKNDLSKNLRSDIKDHNGETEYFTNNIKKQQNNDKFSRPCLPKQTLDNDSTINRSETTSLKNKLFRHNETMESIKLPPAFPPNVIKDIANSIKDYVLRDLKTTSTILTTTTIIPTNPTTQTTTITPAITTTAKYMTTEETPITSTENQLKIQDASVVLEKMMLMLEKMNTMKETILKPENVNYTETFTTQTTITQRQEEPLKQKATALNDQKYIQLKDETRIPHYPQTLQQTLERLETYVPQVAQSQLLNRNTEIRQPHDPGSIQNSPGNSEPHGSQAVQMKEENSLQYYSHPSQLNPYIRAYKPAAPQHNETPYIPKGVQFDVEKPTPFEPQKEHLKTENRLPYDLHVQNNPENLVSYDASQRNREDSMPNYLQLLQHNQRSRSPYVPQGSTLPLKTESRYDPQALQSNPQFPIPYDPINRTYVPEAVELKTDNRIQYLPQALQPKTENQNLYDLQPTKYKPQNRVPYLPSPLQYPPRAADMQAGARYPFDPPGRKTENHTPYNPQPVQYNLKDRSYDYNEMNPYHHSKSKYTPYLKEVKVPTSKKEIKSESAPSNNVITVQTNSGEISPLKIVLQKPFVQNIILTTKPPVTKVHIDEAFNFKKPIKKANRHQVEVKESDVIKAKEDSEYASRHAHKDVYKTIPKSRKTKKEREVIQHYIPRDLEEIESFHEKLERGDAWPHQEEQIEKRVQRPIVKNTNYDDTHFRNFLQTQQKVNDMLEKILAGKTKPLSDDEGTI